MPLTFAHPAAAVPLAKPLGRWGILSALVIGSMVPDLVYIMPKPLPRASSHSLAGLFLFCLPAGIAAYVLFHAALRAPLRALLPARMQAGLSRGRSGMAAATSNRIGVVVSILAGSLTHIVWDAFTHREGLGVRVLPVLATPIGSLWEYNVHVFRLVQHGSTLLGFLLLARWTMRWFRGVDAPPEPPMVPPVARGLIVAGVLAGAGSVAIVVSAEWIPAQVTLGSLQPYLWALARSGLQSLAVGVLLYGAAWHAWRRLTLERTGR